LLVSVQSGGVGLNIVEANHVAFLDRWFNPCVHAQAEDRCHRLKQRKKVNVKYFDVNMSVDEVSSVNSF
jgi:SNF2 family DNA or RNA helicase